MDKPPLQNHRAESKLTVPNDYFPYPTNRGGSRISGKGVHIYKGVGFALLILYQFS